MKMERFSLLPFYLYLVFYLQWAANGWRVSEVPFMAFKLQACLSEGRRSTVFWSK
jgi:hypothetical protein